MKHAFGLALLVALLGTTSGCSIVDRLFLANFDGPYVHKADHINGHGHVHEGETVYEGGYEEGAVSEGYPEGMYDQGACRDGNCRGGQCQDGSCGPAGNCRNGICHGTKCQEGVCPGGVCQSRCQGGHCGKCGHCRHLGRYGGLARHHLSEAEKAALAESDYGATGPAGPPTGAVAYPYYTTRGPRDFLARCPPSVGP
jgi:hypothetical protein